MGGNILFMKINHDCIRDILLYLEENLKIEGHVFLSINLKTLQDNLPEYSAEDVFYSVYNLHQIRFIEGRINNVSNMKMLFCEIENITYSGHRFLATIKPEPIWSKTKTIVSKIGVHTLDFIEGVAHDVAVESAKQAVTIAMMPNNNK